MSIDSEFLSKSRKHSIDIFNVNQQNDFKEIKEEAVKQMEQLVASTQRIHELEDANFCLHEEIEQLRQEFNKKSSMESELKQQIEKLTKKLTLLNIEKENQKVEDLSNQISNQDPVSKNLREKEMLNKFRQCQFDNDALREQINDLNKKYKLKNEEIQIISSEFESLKLHNIELQSQAEMATDNRTKAHLLEIIRSQMEEKIHWETYAENLLRMILVECPNILEVSAIKQYCEISSSELVDLWNIHIKKIINNCDIVSKYKAP